MNPPDSSFLARCPQCGLAVSGTPDRIGQTITCDVCLEEFQLQAPAESSPEPTEDEATRPATAGDAARASEAVGTGPSGQRPPVTEPRTEPGQQPAHPDSQDDQWLQLDDDLTDSTPEDYLPRSELLEDYEFTVPCRLCGTRLSATHLQVGKKIKCPDCFSSFEVKEPPKHARRQRTSALEEEADDDDFKLSDPIERPKYQSLSDSAQRTAAPSPRPVGPPGDGADPGPGSDLSPGADALRKAEEELAEEERARPRLPESPLTSDLVPFLLDPNLLVRLVVLALAVQLELAAVLQAITLMSSSGGMGKFASLMLFVFSTVFGLICFVSISVALLTVVQDSAAGKERIENWPDFSITDWFSDSMHLMTALFVAILPGFLIGQLFVVVGWQVYGWALGITSLLTGLLFFPYLLVSNLEAGSPMNFASKPVFDSLWQAGKHWRRFLVISLGLALTGALIWQMRRLESLWLNLIAALAVMAITMIYFRTLGRLVWTCQEVSLQRQR